MPEVITVQEMDRRIMKRFPKEPCYVLIKRFWQAGFEEAGGKVEDARPCVICDKTLVEMEFSKGGYRVCCVNPDCVNKGVHYKLSDWQGGMYTPKKNKGGR